MRVSTVPDLRIYQRYTYNRIKQVFFLLSFSKRSRYPALSSTRYQTGNKWIWRRDPDFIRNDAIYGIQVITCFGACALQIPCCEENSDQKFKFPSLNLMLVIAGSALSMIKYLPYTKWQIFLLNQQRNLRC